MPHPLSEGLRRAADNEHYDCDAKTLNASADALDALHAENARLREAARLSIRVIEALAEQQAMTDESYLPALEKIRAALEAKP